MDWRISQAKTRTCPPSFKEEPIRNFLKVNRCNLMNTKDKWTNEALEEAIDAVENGTTSLRKASKHWNTPLTSLSDHLYRKTKSTKLGPRVC